MADERPDLGRAPAWARHLHDCMHAMQVQQQSDRHSAANRDMAIEASLRLISEKLGAESDDGKSGTGIVGELRRTSANVASLMAERNMMRGALAAITAAGTLILLGLKSWILQITGQGPNT
ncbi:hypothetical protein [Phenylobacterium deserti]|uniref:Uncharacterized protein n=1 Tax=Phenylobacterium deserti TaxID=1914756 RepID=A0A328AC12_9CAUL|nr:hypothetical protein [Phenylobacterium deserti]RAK52145.1 hypothetical protein DJ018_13395 [Phenylobacterium deserti]